MGAHGPRLILREPGPAPAAGAGKVFDLPLDGVIRAGSAPACQIRIPRPGVLEAHCWFKCQGGRVAVFVKDPQARITVNGAQVQKKLLEPGDTIQVADAILEFEAAEKDPLVGKSLAGYRIEERLGLGAMGTVYKATQLSLERCVALKILSPELTKDREFVTEFLSEARAAAKLNHPHVVQVYDAGAVSVASLGLDDTAYASVSNGGGEEGEGPSLYFFSMEFLPGGTVSRLLEKEGKLPLERALQIGRDTARALVWAEEHGIVHRDIKPDNLLFAADGAAKVADLGIAADLYGVKGATDGEKRPRGVGSPRYMAPEQALGGTIDHRADIYALGSTLYRLISGRPPFEGKTAAEIIKAKTTTDAPPLDAVAPDVPPAVATLVNRMIARDPDARPATCVEVLSEIEDGLQFVRSGGADDEAEAADDEDDTRNTGVPRARRKRRRAGGDGRPYVETTGGKATLLASGLMILSSLIFSVLYQPHEAESVVTIPGAVQPAAPDPAIPVEPDDDAEAEAKKTAATDPRRPKKGTSQVAALRKLTTIESDYKAGFLTGAKALEQIEAFKKEHLDDPVFQEEADRTLKFIQEVRLTAGKNALAKMLPKDIEPLVAKKNFKEVAKKLGELRVSYPEIAAEVDAELKKVDAAADGAWTAASAEADRLASTADYASAAAHLKEASASLPERLGKAAQEKIAALEASEKEHAAVSKALAAELEKVGDAVGALDFDKAISIATAIPQPKSPVLAWKRTLAIEEAKLLQEAWKALQDGVAKKAAGSEPMDLGFGGPSPAPPVSSKLKGLSGGAISYQPASAAKVESRDITGLSSKCLRELAAAGVGSGPDALPTRVLEGLGLLVLDRQGPARGSEILGDPRLGETKIESYKLRLEEEKESFLGRVARVAQARVAKVKGKVAEAEALTTDLTAWILSCRPLPGYDRVKDTLAKAFLAARSESVRVGVPQSLISGKVQSYKPDGSIEILYDFNSEPELKDFRSVKGGSQIELYEGKAKLRGEFRIGKGEMFRKRLSLLAKVTTGGYSSDSPNINFALWTSDGDKVSPKVPDTDAEAIPDPGEETPVPAGLPQDYFVFGVGYKVHVYNQKHRAFEYLSLRGVNTPIQMPAYALIGARRGLRVHEIPEDDCVWAAPAAGKVKGAQVIKISMKPGELPVWNVNSRTMPVKDGKGTDLLRRTDPYMGSVTIFTNGEVIDLESIFIEAELNPTWIDAQLTGIAEKELKKIEPNYPFAIAKPNPEEEWNELLEGAGPKGKAAKKKAKAKGTGAKASPTAENG